MAGIIGSKTYGVSKNIDLYNVKVLGNTGAGLTANCLAGIEFAVNHHEKSKIPGVANLSFGNYQIFFS